MTPIRTWGVIATVVAYAACSSASEPDAPVSKSHIEPKADAGKAPAQGTAESEELLAPPPEGKGIQLRMDSTIAAGEEHEVCQFVTMPEGGLWVNRQEIRFSHGSHHVILWRTGYTEVPTVDTTGATVDTTGVFDCSDGPSASWTIISPAGISQSANAPALLDGLPDGTAVRFDSNSVYVLDLHALNVTDGELTSQVRINLWQVPDDSVKTEAGIYFFYDPFIRLDAHAAGHTRMSCPVPSDLTWLNVQTHTHRRGLGGSVDLSTASGDVERVYESHDWENVPMLAWKEGKALHPGDAIDYRCAYQNEEDHIVVQGQTTRDEMCNLFGLYYPRDKAFETCSVDGDPAHFTSAAHYIGGGEHDGAATARCLHDSLSSVGDSGAALNGCVVDSCARLSLQLTPAVNCQYAAQYLGGCAECRSDAASCARCIESTCKDTMAALAAASCDQ